MTALEKFQQAHRLYKMANLPEALALFREVCTETADPGLKVECLLAMISLFDPVYQRADLLKTCDEGLHFSTIIKNKPAQAYFQAKKAICYIAQCSVLLSIKKDITLAPKRINFALESDRDLYTSVTKGLEILVKQADELFVSAFKLLQVDDHDALAHLHCLQGDKFSAQSMHYLIEHMRHAKLLTYTKWLGVRPRQVLALNQQKEFKRLSNGAIREYLESVRYYEMHEDHVGVACAYHDLSNHLQGIRCYRRAKKYLRLSEKASAAKELLPQRARLQQSIEEKNKNLPDHKSNFPRPVLRRNIVINLRNKLHDWFSNT